MTCSKGPLIGVRTGVGCVHGMRSNHSTTFYFNYGFRIIVFSTLIEIKTVKLELGYNKNRRNVEKEREKGEKMERQEDKDEGDRCRRQGERQ